MTLSELAVKSMPPAWKFWRSRQRRFWVGAILADYARITGSEAAERKANEIFEEAKDVFGSPKAEEGENKKEG